jgi:hypothetical protein
VFAQSRRSILRAQLRILETHHTTIAVSVVDDPVNRSSRRLLMFTNIVRLTRPAILGLALALTFGATLAVPTFADNKQESRRASDSSYKDGFRQGFRTGFADGRKDARSEQGNKRSLRKIVTGETPFDRGFANGYERGYGNGFDSVRRK